MYQKLIKKIQRKRIELLWDLEKNLFPFLYERPMMRFVKEHNQGHLLGAEIGTRVGYNAYNILNELDIGFLHLIDPYCSYEQGERSFDTSGEYEKAKRRLKKWWFKIVFVKKYSADAVEDVPYCLDFVYIDGNHEYKYIKEDIELYWPKIKKGGVIGGHDFSGDDLDVVKAVMEFSNEHKLKLYTESTDWWFVKE